MKKTVILLLVACVAAASFATGSGESPTTAGAHPRAGQTNRFGWTIPAQRITIRQYEGQDNPESSELRLRFMRAFLLEEFNVDIDRIVYDTDKNERLNLMLASNTYPGVITFLDDAQYANWVFQGRAREISGLVDKHGPNIKKELGDLYSRYLTTDGKLHGAPVGWGLLHNPGYTAHIRWDVYLAHGSPKLVTLDDYYAYLKKLVTEQPTDSRGNRVYALSLNEQVTPEILSGFWGLRLGWKADAAAKTVQHWINTQEGLDMALWFNKVQREGMLDPTAFINKYDDWKALFSATRLTGHLGSWWHTWNAGHEIWNVLWPDWKEDQRFVQIAVKAAGVATPMLGPKNTMGSMSIITDKEARPEDVVKWWNFEITPMGTKLIGLGVPNFKDTPVNYPPELTSLTSVWHIDEKGTWWFDEKHKQNYINGVFDFTTLDATGGNLLMAVTPLRFTNEARPVQYWYGNNFVDAAKWDAMRFNNLRHTVFDNTALQRIAYPPDRNEVVIKQQVTDIGRTGLAQAVMAGSAEECRTIFMNMRNQANQTGLKALETYVTAEYTKNVTAWKMPF